MFHFRMYDIDGNGSIDQKEMIKIVQGIYDMIGMVCNMWYQVSKGGTQNEIHRITE